MECANFLVIVGMQLAIENGAFYCTPDILRANPVGQFSDKGYALAGFRNGGGFTVFKTDSNCSFILG